MRPVDLAMAANRVEKQRVRERWVDATVHYAARHATSDELLYLSLCGGEGRDLDIMVERRIIELTETGAISPSSAHRVAAVEYDLTSVAALLHKFPGLKIYDRPFKDLVRGESHLRYPDKRDVEFCRARVINLDLNAPLKSVEDDEVTFPVLIWIQKLGEMHSQRPRKDWCLCLTLHAELTWGHATCALIQDFLAENFRTSPNLAANSKLMLGSELYNRIIGNAHLNFSNLSRELQQKVLMIIVPKKITQMMQNQGWKISTGLNLRYGRPAHAPMVSWIFHFEHDVRAISTPSTIYAQSLASILSAAGKISGRGRVIDEDRI